MWGEVELGEEGDGSWTEVLVWIPGEDQCLRGNYFLKRGTGKDLGDVPLLSMTSRLE